VSPRNIPAGHDGPVNAEGDPEDVVQVLLGNAVGEAEADIIEPALDE
jgi:hypothetical protein